MDETAIDALVMPSIDYLKLADEIKRDLKRVVLYFVDVLHAEGQQISDSAQLTRTDITAAIPDMYADPMFAIRHLFAARVLTSCESGTQLDPTYVRLSQEFLVENHQTLHCYYSRRGLGPQCDPDTP